MLLENIQRAQLSPLEEAAGLQEILKGDTTQTALAKSIGKTQSWVANRLRLLAAPESLRDLLAGGDISPKHVIALLPYSAYPVLDDIVKEIRSSIKEGNKVSVKTLGNLIDQLCFGYSHSKSVLVLDDFEYDDRHLEPFFDFAACEGCEDCMIHNRYSTQHNFCLNPGCWKVKLNEAKGRYENKKQAKAKKRATSEKINIRNMDYDEYQRLELVQTPGSSQHFDVEDECTGCDYWKEDEEGGHYCVSPDCYNTKNRKGMKALADREAEEAVQVWEHVDAYLDALPDTPVQNVGMLRLAVTAFGKLVRAEVARAGLSRWAENGKVPSQYTDEFSAMLAKIEDKDLERALTRLTLAQTFNTRNSNGVAGAKMENLWTHFPEVFENVPMIQEA